MRNTIIVLALALVACDPIDAVQGPDAGETEPDATTSTLCWERCADDTWLEPWPSASPEYVICHDLDTTCDLVACDTLVCDAAELWCPPSYGGACWCNAKPESGPDAWCMQ